MAPQAWERQYENLKSTVAPLAALGVQVTNTNLKSVYPWWPKESLDECLARYA
jgi:D-mannonate dehydratase